MLKKVSFLPDRQLAISVNLSKIQPQRIRQMAMCVNLSFFLTQRIVPKADSPLANAKQTQRTPGEYDFD